MRCAWKNCREQARVKKFCRNHWHSDWVERNREHVRAYRRAFQQKLRLAVLKLYGGKCVCCGEKHIEFLAIDHVNGGGKKHIGGFVNVDAYRRWLLVKKRKGFRVLCHNCNQARGFYGYCPHERA